MNFETLLRMSSNMASDNVEQTINDDSLFRPMSLADLSALKALNNDPSADKSTAAYQMWNHYRERESSLIGSPKDHVEDEEIDEHEGHNNEESTPRIRVRLLKE